jgi:DNA-binding Xre family transcriptional regulator
MPGKAVSDVLREALAKDRASLYEIAAEAKVPRNSLSQFVAGTRQSLSLQTVDRVCEALGLKLVPAGRRRRRKG